MIKINSVDKFYNKNKSNQIQSLKDINIELPDKGIIAIFGPSGCGKTTLLNVIGGLDNVNKGNIFIDGQNIKYNTDIVRNKYIGYIFQNYNLNNNYTNFENVSASLKICGVNDEKEINERVVNAFENVGMSNYMYRYPNNLSGGEKQRIAIARAIVKQPKIILADEPTGNLDEHNTIIIMNLLKKLSEKCLVLLVTHEDSLLDAYCDKTIEIKDGSIVNYYDNQKKEYVFNKDKRKIYLGDLKKQIITSDDVTLAVYGDTFQNNFKMTLVNIGGKIYLKIDNNNVKIVDSSSELQLLEEKSPHFEEPTMNFKILPQVKYGKFGKLFGFKDTLLTSFRDIVFNKKRKKRLLPLCMFLISMILVFFVAYASTSLKNVFDAKDWYNENVYYVKANYLVNNLLKEKNVGVDFYKCVNKSDKLYSYDQVTFDCGKYESFNNQNNTSLTIETIFMSCDLINENQLVVGKHDELNDYETILSTKACDMLIDDCRFGYIKSYEDLIGLYSIATYNHPKLKVVGVVKNSENIMYVNNNTIAYMAADNMSNDYINGFSAKTDLTMGYKVEEGECVIIDRVKNSSTINLNSGDNFFFRGEKMIIKRVVREQVTYDDFLTNSGINLMTFDEYIDKALKKDYPDIDETEYNVRVDEYKENLYYEYYLDYYYQYINEYCNDCFYTISDNNTRYISWLATEKNLLSAKFYITKINDIFYNAYLFKQNNGYYPNKSYVFNKRYVLSDLYSSDVYKNYYDLRDELFIYNNESFIVVLNIKDFVTVFNSYGTNDFSLNFRVKNEEYFLVHVTDKQKFENNLNDLEYDDVIKPIDFYNFKINEYANSIITSLIIISTIIIVISFVIYFLMRSELMSKIKEIGIWRAIGVSKRNLIFRSMIESFVLMTMTFFVGYLFASIVVSNLYSNNSIIETIIYYPPFIAIILLLLMYSIGIFVGCMPVIKLLKKTPSSILTKYDI